MNILFTICGRAGSKGLRNKNLKKMNGVPLAYYTLAAIKLFENKYPEYKAYIAVNTDSKELVEMFKEQKDVQDIIFVERKENLAGDKVAKVDVIRDTYLNVSEKTDIDMVVDLDLTSPLRAAEDIYGAIEAFNADPELDLVTSVVASRRSPYFNMVEKKEKYYRKICDSNFTTRQEAPATYELNASIYVYRPAFLKKEITNTILENNVGIVTMKDYLVLDIDSEDDVNMMEFLHGYYLKTDAGIKEVYDRACVITGI